MITIQTQCEDRKEMARKLAVFLGTRAIYLRAPSYAFQIGPATVNRDGSVSGEEEALAPVAEWLKENGYISEQTDEHADEQISEQDTPVGQEQPEVQETPAESETLEPVQEAGHPEEHEQLISELRERLGDELPAPTGFIDVEQEEKNGRIAMTLIHICETGWTMPAMVNLIQTLYTRQDLINAMLKMDSLRIDDEVIDLIRGSRLLCVSDLETLVHDERTIQMIEGFNISGGTVTMEMPFDEQMPERWMLYGALVTAIIKQAKASKKSKAVRLREEIGKYHANAWLNRLGFGGVEHKDFRHSLMSHLGGYAAFKTDDRMQAHKNKLAEQRRIRREMNGEEHSDD